MTDSCGCCEGTERRTPAPIANRPGLGALTRRIGTHFDFFESMKARLSNLPWTDGVSPLRRLTTRESADPSIALLDAWSSVADVLTFYQERIANEGYLRTAVERRSILELSRLIGYRPRPGVAAGVRLAFTLEKDAGEIIIPAGTAAKSIPGQDELPQTFETSEDLKARPEWNELRPRLSRPQNLNRNTETIYFAGTATNLKINDLLLIDRGDDMPIPRFVQSVEPDVDADRTRVTLQADPFSSVLFRRQVLAAIAAYRKATGTATPKPGVDADIEAALNELQNNLNATNATLVEMDTAAHDALTELRTRRTTINNTARGFDRLSSALTAIAVDDEPTDISILEEQFTRIDTEIRTNTIRVVTDAGVRTLLEILAETFKALTQLSESLNSSMTMPQLKAQVLTTIDNGRPGGNDPTRSLKELEAAAQGANAAQLEAAIGAVATKLQTVHDNAGSSGTLSDKQKFVADVRDAANTLNAGDLKAALDQLLAAIVTVTTIPALKQEITTTIEHGRTGAASSRSLKSLRDEAKRNGSDRAADEVTDLIDGLNGINSQDVDAFKAAVVTQVASHSPTVLGAIALGEGLETIDELARIDVSSPLPDLAAVAGHVQICHYDVHVSTGSAGVAAQFLNLATALRSIVDEADKATDGTLAKLIRDAVPEDAPANSDAMLKAAVPSIREPLRQLLPDPPLSLSGLIRKSRETAVRLDHLTENTGKLQGVFHLYGTALDRLVRDVESIATRVRSVFASEVRDVEARYAFLTSFAGAAKEPATTAYGVLQSLSAALPDDPLSMSLDDLVKLVTHHVGPDAAIDWLKLSPTGVRYEVANIAARDALTGVNSGDIARVIDASSDPTVTAGRSASYIHNGTHWIKIAVEPNLEQILHDVQNQGAALAVLAARLTTLIRELEELRNRVTVVDGSVTPPDPEPALAIQRLLGLRGALALRQANQPRGRADLTRELSDVFDLESDVLPQLLQVFEPAISSDLYRAWRNARVELPAPKVYALRARAAVFGYNAPPDITVTRETVTKTEWTPAGDEAPDKLYLDNEYSGIVPGGFVALQTPNRSQPVAFNVTQVLLKPRTAYGISGKSTDITVELNEGVGWWNPNAGDGFDSIRGTTVYVASELLELAEEPITRKVGQPTSPSRAPGDGPVTAASTELEEAANEIELETLYDGFEVGRSFFITGERVDLPGVASTEHAVLAGVKQVLRSDLPGDTPHSRLVFANDLTFTYRRETTTLRANVVGATHGETQAEVIGSGDAGAAFQRFTLSRAPLTHLSAPTPSGSDSTLSVRVGGIQWIEADEFAMHLGTDRVFVTSTDNDGQTSVTFGDGRYGARLPTGLENVTAEYRVGIGVPGNVQAEQISQLVDRPLGLKEVLNPQRASGGADPEPRDRIRENAPRAVVALDRLISIQDYSDLAQTFGGIGKASARRLTDGRRELIHVTVAGADDAPIDPGSDLLRNLQQQLSSASASSAPVKLSVRELGLLIIDAGVRVLAEFAWQDVEDEIRRSLLATFSFQNRSLGQDVTLSEVVSAIQSVRGVALVDVNVLHAVSESITPDQLDGLAEALRARNDQPAKRLTAALAGTKTHIVSSDDENTLKEIAPLYAPRTSLDELLRLNPGVAAEDELPNGSKVIVSRIWPAQVIYLSPAVPDTLILSEIR